MNLSGEGDKLRMSARLTYSEIINSCRSINASCGRNTKVKIGDFIGMALANEWSDVNICEEVSSRTKYVWTTVHELVAEYRGKYGYQEVIQ